MQLLSLTHHHIEDQTLIDQEEPINLLFDAIATLSSLNKAIILLYLEDLSYEEIASITGLTKSNVSVKLVRIKKALEIQLKVKTKTKVKHEDTKTRRKTIECHCFVSSCLCV